MPPGSKTFSETRTSEVGLALAAIAGACRQLGGLDEGRQERLQSNGQGFHYPECLTKP